MTISIEGYGVTITHIDDLSVVARYKIANKTFTARLTVGGGLACFEWSHRLGRRSQPMLSYEQTAATSVAEYVSQGAPIINSSWVGVEMFRAIKQLQQAKEGDET